VELAVVQLILVVLRGIGQSSKESKGNPGKNTAQNCLDDRSKVLKRVIMELYS